MQTILPFLQRSKWILSTLVILLLSLSSTFGQNCSVNAGVPFTTCPNVPIDLVGNKSGLFQGTGATTWSQTDGPSVTITDPSALTTSIIGATPNTVYKFMIQATCQDGTKVANEVTISTNPLTTPTAGPDAMYCPGTYSLSANAPASGETGTWTVVGTNNGVTISTPNSPTSNIVLASNKAGATTLRWTISNASTGCSAYDDVVISNKGGITTVTAGPDQSLSSCYSSTTSATLGSSFPGNGTGGQGGLWTVVTAPNTPTFGNATAYNTSISNLKQGIYTLRWTVSGTCANGVDDMQITVPAPVGSVTTASITSGNQVFCDARTDAVLVGSTPLYTNENVLWQKTAGTGTVTNPTNTTTTVTGLNGTSSSSYKYTITNSVTGCNSVAATRTISYTTAPTITVNGGNDIILAPGVYSASIPFTVSGGNTTQYTVISYPAGYTPPGWTSASSPQTISGLNQYGTYVIRFKRFTNGGSGGCSEAYSDIKVYVSKAPTAANAGTDQMLACNITNTALAGNPPSIGTGNWSQVSGPSTATITNPTSNNATISDLINGKYTFRWTIQGGSNVAPSQDEVNVVVASTTPTAANAGVDQTVCYATPVILTGNNPALNETGTWTVSPSTGISFSDIHSPTAYVIGLAPSTLYTFTWTIANSCGTTADNVQITTSATQGPVQASAGSDQCKTSGTTSVTMTGNNPTPGSGVWTKISGPACTITNNTKYNTTVTGMTDGTYLFEWAITYNACNVSRDTVMITISAAATAANAGADQTICGTAITLAANTPAIGTGYWTQSIGNAGPVITDPAQPNTTVTGLTDGYYKFTWTISNNACASNSAAMVAKVSTPPTTADAGIDQSVCGASATTLAANTITNGTGYWNVLSAPTTPSFSASTSPTSTVSNLAMGYYFLQWVSQNGTYCPVSTDDMEITVTPTANAGADQNLCNLSETQLSGNAGSSGTWSLVSGPNTPTITTTGPNTANVSGMIPGTYTFQYSIVSTGCNSTDQMNVTISAPATPADAGADIQQCGGTSIALSGNAPGGSETALWSKISGTGGTFSPNGQNASLNSVSTGVYWLKYTITNGSCSSSDQVMAEIYATPTTADAGSDQNVCGYTTSLEGNAPTVGLGNWSQVSGPGTSDIASIISPNSSVTFSTSGTYVMRWTIANGPCLSSSDDVTLNINVPPTTPDAGPDQNLCNVASTTLAGNTITTGAGMWSQVSGPNTATFTDPSNPTTTVTGLIAGTYEFSWTSSYLTCSASDVVTINDYGLPSTATTGGPLSICNYTTPVLNGSTPAVGVGTWSQLTGPNNVTITTPNSPNSTLSGTIPGTYTFQWTISNGTCASTSATTDLTVNALPSLAIAGVDQDLCNLTSTTLAATAPTSGTGTWTLVSGPNTPTITDVNLYNSDISNLVPGTYLLDWTVANGPCTSSDQMQINVYATPSTADAGADQVICGNNLVTMAANTPVNGMGTWTKVSGPGSPTITNPNSPTTTITGLSTGTYIYKWTISNGSCASNSDNVQLQVSTSNVTTSDAGPDQTGASLCGLTATTLAANNPTVGTGAWSIISGTGGWFGNASSRTSSFSGTAGNTYDLRWTITSVGCVSTDDVTIFFPKNPTPSDAGVDQTNSAMCGITATTLSANTPTVGTGLWTIVSGTGGSLGDATDPNTSFSGTQGSVYSLQWTISNAPCSASSDLVSVEFKTPAVAPTGTSPQAFCQGISPTLNNIIVSGSNIQWYDASTGGTLLAGTTPLVNGATYYASQTVNGCESQARLAITVSVYSCVGPIIDDVVVSLDENSPNGTSVYDEHDKNTGTDIDGDGDHIAYSIIAGNTLGAFTIDPATGIITVADVTKIDFETTQTFVLTVEASDGLNTDTGTVTINLNNLNDNPPVAVADSYSVNEGGTLTVPAPGVLGNDSDADGNAITAIKMSDPTHGTLVLNADGSFVYTHDGSETTSDSFTYKVNDGTFDGNTVTVSITIIPVNDPPVANNDTYNVDEGGTLNISAPGILSNDTDAEGDPLTAILVSNPAHGTLTLNADGSFTYTHDGSETTSDSFTYKANDGTIDGNTATVSISINPVNDPPVANNDTYNVDEGGTLNISAPGILSNDTDAEGDPLTAILVSNPAHGTLTLNADGSFTYTHDGSETTLDSFTYKANDGTVDGNVATVTITINPVNDIPVAVNDNATTNEDTPVSVDVLNNDHQIDEVPLTVTITGNPSNGSVVVNGDNTVTYTPNADFNGTDTFTYQVCDATPDCATATVTITVTPVNDIPVAVDDNSTTNEDTPVSINVLGNDTGLGDGGLTVTIPTAPANGTVTVNPDNTVTYTPNPDFNGTDTFTYQVCDATPDCATATVTITVTPVNDVPVAMDDNATTNEDTPVSISVLGNDTGLGDGGLTVTIPAAPANGTVTVNPDNTVTYTPNPDFNGTDTFTYQVCDATPDCATATVTITINPVNDIPAAVDDNATTNEDTPVTINVLGNDTGLGDGGLTVTIPTAPANGTVTVNPDNSVTYTPNPDFNGNDTFTYQVCDVNGECSTATVTITVTPVNDIPMAVDDNATTNEDTPVTINVLGNDTGLGDGGLTVTIPAAPANGTVTVNPDNTVTYTPNPDFNGTDTFTYQVCDATPDCATATVTITINPVNDIPVAVDDNASTNEDTPVSISVLGNDTGLGDGGLTVTITNAPANGTVTVNPDNTVTYTPNPDFNGTDTFTYQVCDANGDCATAIVNITIASVNDVPVAVDDNASTNENTSVTVGILNNDSGQGDGGLNISIPTDPSHGTVTINGDNTVTYTPETGFAGGDTFTYQVCDANGDCATAIVSITVNSLYQPIAVNDSASTVSERPVVISVLNNDQGLENGGLVVTVISNPANGTVVVNADNTLTYTPNHGFTGVDTFSYEVCDVNSECASATVTVTVNGSIYIPDGFSPNGDGINDTFVIPDLNQYKKVSIEIFNRWGNVVYKSDNYHNDWDGKANVSLSLGTDLPVGTYFYLVSIADNGKKITGYVYITR